MMEKVNRFQQLVGSIQSQIQKISVEELETLPKNFCLIDVREESEWRKGHLPAAIHISKGMLEVNIEQQVPDVNTKIVLYCGGGSRSTLAAENLQRMGYQHVYSMTGGFRAWVNAGKHIEL